MATLEKVPDVINIAARAECLVEYNPGVGDYIGEKLIAFLQEGHYLVASDIASGYTSMISYLASEKCYSYVMVDTIRKNEMFAFLSSKLSDLILQCCLNLSFFTMISKESVESYSL